MNRRLLAMPLCFVVAASANAQQQDLWEVRQVAPGVYASVVVDPALYSQYANSLIVVGDQGVLVVDSRDTEEAGAQLLDEIRQITDKPVQYLVNTHWHWDHINGNAVFRDAFPEIEIIAHPATARLMEQEGPARIQAEIDRRQTRIDRLDRYRMKGETDSGETLEADDFKEIDRIAEVDRTRIAAREALVIADERRQAHYTGEESFYGILEDRFLVMEGVAEWARYQLLLKTPEVASSHDARVQFLRGTDNEWAQDEGLALFLVLDQLVADWPKALLEEDLRSPFELLRDAVSEPSRNRLQPTAQVRGPRGR